MSRMANPPFLNRPVLVRLVLCLLVGCLAVHFLVEDAFLFSGFAPLIPDATNTEHPLFDEIEHQDDLVFQTSLPENIAGDGVPLRIAWAVLLKKQIASHIIPPPKAEITLSLS